MGYQHPSALALGPALALPWRGLLRTPAVQRERLKYDRCMGRGMRSVGGGEWCVRLLHMFSDSHLRHVILVLLALFSRLCRLSFCREVVP